MTKQQQSGGGPAPFLTKTHEMVSAPGTDEVISWGEEGRSFVVWKPVEFARDLLPAHFKHNNFSSFVRQLNTYGFRKVVPDRWEFANDSFRRGEEKLLCGIRRRKAIHTPTIPVVGKLNMVDQSTSNSGEVHSSSSNSSPPLPLPLPPPCQSQQLRELSDENEKLKNDNQALTEELALAKQQYEELRSLHSKYVERDEMNTNLKEELAMGEAEESEYDEGSEVNCLKLFGVMLKEFRGEEKSDGQSKKRGRCEGGSGGGRLMKMGYKEKWIPMPSTAT